jgi:hypothetical protein
VPENPTSVEYLRKYPTLLDGSKIKAHFSTAVRRSPKQAKAAKQTQKKTLIDRRIGRVLVDTVDGMKSGHSHSSTGAGGPSLAREAPARSCRFRKIEFATVCGRTSVYLPLRRCQHLRSNGFKVISAFHEKAEFNFPPFLLPNLRVVVTPH